MTAAQILLVEDESIVGESIQNKLNSLGHRVLAVAVSGEEAVQKAEEMQPELVLVEVKLQGEMDGLTVAEQIRTRFDIPVIHLAAYTDDETRQRAGMTEPFGYLLKPFTVEELGSTIEVALYKHKLDKKLKESEARYRVLAREKDLLQALLDNIPDHIYFKDTDSRFIRISQSLSDWFGLSEPAQAIGKTDFDFFSAEHAQQAYADEQEMIRSGQPLMNIEEKETWPDGQETWVLTTKMLLRDETGKIIGTFGISRNITENKQAEEALRESEERYRTLFEQAYDAIFLEDEDDNILEVNPRVCELLGYTREELLRMKVPDLQAPEIRGRAGRTVKDQLEQYGWGAPFEVTDLHRDGRRIPVEVSINRLTGKGAGLVLAIVRDITERKRAEAWMQQRNRELELLNRASRAFISTLDLDQVLATILEEVRRSLDVVACSAWLIDPKTNELVCRQVTDPQSKIVRGWRLAPGQGIAGWAAQRGQSLIVPDVWADKRYFKGVDEQTGLKIRSILTIPLQVKETVIGVIQVVDGTVDRFDSADLQLVESLASAAAIAIENAQLYEEADRLRAFNQNIVQSMNEGIILEDESGHITFVNPEAANLLKYSPEELIGQHWRGLIAPEQIAQVEAENAKRPHGIASRYETMLMTRQGQKIPVVVSVRPLFEADQFTGVLSVFTDITERVQAETQIQTSLQEKEILLKEIHHRVKNNLQIISSLLDLQSDYIQDPQILETLRESQNRIRSMALIHTQLYQSRELARIDMAGYVWNLISYLGQAYNVSLADIDWQVDIDELFFDIDTAIPCGLIINELVSNCLKHAFPDNRAGKIRIEFHLVDHLFRLVVSDNGVGFPTEVDFRDSKSLGLQLVGILTNQLDGTIELEQNEGTTFKITFA